MYLKATAEMTRAVGILRTVARDTGDADLARYVDEAIDKFRIGDDPGYEVSYALGFAVGIGEDAMADRLTLALGILDKARERTYGS